MRNLKRALSLALASVMLLGMMVVGSSAASYPDVDQTNHLEAIEVLQMLGIMEGDTSGNFNPKGEVTRYQMAALVCKLMGLTPGGNSPFTDFGSSDNWAKPYVAAVYNKGIMKGTGATTFDGSRSMTAAEAGMAMLKCLGYFLNEAELKDTSWKLATTREANKIDLYRGINYWSDQIMTRDNVAQMVLNTLESDVVVATPPALNVSVTTGGANVDVTGSWTYPAAENNFSQDYQNRTSGSGYVNMQLCEKLFENDLKHLADTTDKMGRRCTKWTYKNRSIDSPMKPDLVYTKAVKGKDIFSDLGKPTGLVLTGGSGMSPNPYITVDGVSTLLPAAVTAGILNKAGFAVNSTSDTKIGGDGLIVEVYYNTDSSVTENLHLVVLKPVVDQIDQIDENDDGERIVKIGALEYVTNDFEEDDWVVYTQNATSGTAKDEVIQSMYAMEVQTGTLTKTIGSDKVAIDGKEYTINDYDNGEISIPDVKDEVDFYLDANGYIAKIEQSEAVINVDNLAYVENSGVQRGNWATLRLADGTKKTVDTDKNYSDEGVGGTDLAGKIVSFKEDKSGEYKLTPRTTIENTTGTITFKKGEPVIDATTDIRTDSKTVFVCKAGDDVFVYTGYKNATNINADGTSDKAVAYCRDNNTNKAAILVYVETNDRDEIGAVNDLAFIVYDKNVKRVDEGDEVKYYEYNAVVDGEITTVKVDATVNGSVISETADSSVTRTDKQGIKVFKGMSMDGDGIVTTATPATGGAGNDFIKAASTGKVKNDTIILGGTSYAYTDDVKVFFVDDDFNIREGEITEVRNDDTVGDVDGNDNSTSNKYRQVLFTVDEDDTGTVTQIVIWEN